MDVPATSNTAMTLETTVLNLISMLLQKLVQFPSKLPYDTTSMSRLARERLQYIRHSEAEGVATLADIL